ncbi:MAG: DUF2997 domain-containing protein [Candidatus Heimdallarchaeaceae archaeon]
MAQVILRINPKTGKTTYEVMGVEGASCETITEVLERNNEVVDKYFSDEHGMVEITPDYVSNLG